MKQDKKQVVLDWLWNFAKLKTSAIFIETCLVLDVLCELKHILGELKWKKYTRTTVQRHLSQLKPYLNTKTILSCGRKLIVGHLHWGDDEQRATKLLVSVVQSFACTYSGSMQHSCILKIWTSNFYILLLDTLMKHWNTRRFSYNM